MAATDFDLVRGTLDLLIPKTLTRGPMHGLVEFVIAAPAT